MYSEQNRKDKTGISFLLSNELTPKIDNIAKREHRSRAAQIAIMLENLLEKEKKYNMQDLMSGKGFKGEPASLIEGIPGPDYMGIGSVSELAGVGSNFMHLPVISPAGHAVKTDKIEFK